MKKNYDMKKLIRCAAAEGAVLLKNNGVLPFESGTKLSLFSRLSEDWIFRGIGSGGNVQCSNQVSLTSMNLTC